MSEHKLLIAAWIVLIGILLLFAHGMAYAEGAINKDGSINMSKQDLEKLSKFLAAKNLQLERAIKEGNAWHEKYDKAHNCVMENALDGRATTICFEVCEHTNRFCGPETQEF